MSEINFLSNDEKKIKKNKSEGENEQKINWTKPGEFKVENNGIIDMFSETEQPKKEEIKMPEQSSEEKADSFFAKIFRNESALGGGFFNKRN